MVECSCKFDDGGDNVLLVMKMIVMRKMIAKLGMAVKLCVQR